MRLNKLKLTNYRNCEELELDFNKSKALIIGKNAQGKQIFLKVFTFCQH